MYEDYTRQALPSKEYRELLGTAICIFNSNNQFIIENILEINNSSYNWLDLTDQMSGTLLNSIKATITNKFNEEIADMFDALTFKRNRIVHGFQITENGEQILWTKEKKTHIQYAITLAYLKTFIRENELLSDKLYHIRNS
ncbi:hypothetical protein [Dyadobacter alkalitolerans]|uniref:hypothetical protein n=1 Tax=Dyadobacter alkalitolerans TaxID=492736 RepID=UPI0004794D91|nr:hypothetical protein [Dyadobacter alkalitolerans]